MSPRPGPRRQSITFRLSESAHDLIDEWAAAETGGNRSEMLRRLFNEAVKLRRSRSAPARDGRAWKIRPVEKP